MKSVRCASSLLLLLLAATVTVCQAPPQVAPLPRDPLEPSTGATFVPDTPQQRALVLSLVERARQNSDLHMATMSPFTLKLSFNAGGQSAYTGAGDMEETWLSGRRWRWSAHLGGFSMVRMGGGGVAYDEKTPGPIPMRIHMLRTAVFWPVLGFSPGALIRIASTKWNGLDVMCVLLSRSGNAATATPGRRWEEMEYCIDVKDGLLRLYSEAPGIYVTYDYSDALHFHNRVLPREITIVEGETTVLSVRLAGITDPVSSDAAYFEATDQMKARGPGAMLMTPGRFPLSVPLSTGQAGSVQPVIVVAEIGADGRVLEAEVLQDSNPALARQALEVVRKASYSPQQEDGVPQQKQWYINVRFGS
jgi:TonB family protein